MNYYTGVGSRQTPEEIQVVMEETAKYLYNHDYILRSGGAKGADVAFEKGAGDKKEIYLPWKSFNNSTSELYEIPEEAFKLAERTHPAWDKCKEDWKKVHARNVLQVLGLDLNTPSDFLICWTDKGLLRGGTATAIRIAKLHDIPIFNLAIEEQRNRIIKKIGG